VDIYRRSRHYAIVVLMFMLVVLSFIAGRNSVLIDNTTTPARVCTEVQLENFAQVCVVHQPCRVYIEIDPNLDGTSFDNVTFVDQGDANE